MSVVYLPFTGDLFHIGHLRAIRQCAEVGEVIIGLLDVPTYKKTVIPYEQRKEMLEAIPEVKMVVKQNGVDCFENLEKFKPDFVASGDGFEPRELDAIKRANCKKLDIVYCEEQSSTKIKEIAFKHMTEQSVKMNFREKAKLDLLEIKEVFDKLGIKFFLMCGTLLGGIREKNIILTDHDIDLGLYGEDIHRSIEIYDAFKKAGFLVGSGESFQFPCETIRRPIWFLLHRNVKTELIFLFKIKDKRTMWYTTRKVEGSSVREYCIWENDAKFFEPLQEIELWGKKFSIPNHYKELLDLWYHNWGIPSGAQVWGYKRPRLWTKDFDPLREICSRCLDSKSSSSNSNSSSSSSSFSLSSSSSKNK